MSFLFSVRRKMVKQNCFFIYFLFTFYKILLMELMLISHYVEVHTRWFGFLLNLMPGLSEASVEGLAGNLIL